MIGSIYLLVLISQSMFVQSATEVSSHEVLLEVIYWELKPYIFTNKHGEIDGIIPRMLEEAQRYCLNKTNVTTTLMRYALKEPSRQSFYDLVRSNITTYGNGRLENITYKKAFWVPVVNKDKKHTEFERTKNIRSFQLIKSDSVAVIVSRSVISLPTKILKGIMSCKQIFVLAFLLSTIVSMTMWLFEHSNNDAFPDSFIRGTATALWWSVVSMTTVGYGDIVPKSLIGRSLAVLWLFIGVMIACVMTATMTDVVSSGGSLDLHGQKMAVLENSYEEKVARETYRAIIMPVRSYQEAVEMVNKGDAFAAVINADVAAWYQDEYYNDTSDNPLRVVEIAPANVYVNCYTAVSVTPELKEVFKCMYTQKEEVYQRSIENFKRYCKKEVLYIGSMSNFIQRNQFIQIVLWIIGGMVMMGTIYEVYRLLCLEKMGEKKEKDIDYSGKKLLAAGENNV